MCLTEIKLHPTQPTGEAFETPADLTGASLTMHVDTEHYILWGRRRSLLLSIFSIIPRPSCFFIFLFMILCLTLILILVGLLLFLFLLYLPAISPVSRFPYGCLFLLFYSLFFLNQTKHSPQIKTQTQMKKEKRKAPTN